MKNYLVIGVAVLLMSACNRKELAESNKQRDSLFTVVNEREASLNEFISSFNVYYKLSGFVLFVISRKIVIVHSEFEGILSIIAGCVSAGADEIQ